MDDSIYRDNLIAKYWTISSGANYKVTNVAPLLIGRFGSAITDLNVGTHGKKLFCKPDTRSDDKLIQIGQKLLENVKKFDGCNND